MVKKHTIYVTYLLRNDKDNNIGFGNSEFIQCGYVNKLSLDEITAGKITIYFNNINSFRFLNATGGVGYSANGLYLLLQIVGNEEIEGGYKEKRPESDKWRIYDVTDQIIGHTVGNQLSGTDIISSVFTIPLVEYTSLDYYNINEIIPELNYPEYDDDNNLLFGEEEFFFGNVETDIEAIVLTTDIPIYLPPDEFNTSTNKTWTENSDIYISEVGIYDEDNNLVAVGKLNDPIRKAQGISRTIMFGFDF